MHQRILQTIQTLLIIALVVGTGCRSGAENGNGLGINVEAHRAAITDAHQSIAYSGTIEESETIPLSFSVVGSVARVLVSEGDPVHQGQVLATLNEESFRNAYEAALATEKQAEDAYTRLQPMYKNGNLPAVKFVEADADLQRAKAATTIAHKNLADCSLRAPVSGIVGRRSVDPGMNALPNITSLTLVRIEKVYANIPVSEREISAIHKGQHARVTIAALNDAAFTGVVEEVGVMADPLTHTYRVKIGIANSALRIKPGMICNVQIDQIRPATSTVVSSPAVMVDEAGRHYVYVVDPGTHRAARRYVTPGALLNCGIEILAGLQRDELVVTAGQHKIADSTLVHVINN